MSNLTKQERILAYRIVDEVLGRAIPAVVLKHQIPDDLDVDRFGIELRAAHILQSLRDDARDLWKEG